MTTNRLLDRLPAKDRAHVLAACTQVELTLSQVLAEPGDAIAHVYFPTDSFVSPAESARRPGARSIEIGGVGHFGLLRSPALWQALQQFVRAPRAATTAAAAAGAR